MVIGDVDYAGIDMKIMFFVLGDKGILISVEFEKVFDRFERVREDNIRVGCNYSYFK